MRRKTAQRSHPVILLTGRPGVGKTTVIQRVLSTLGLNAGGFYTRELRAGRRRTGFELVTLAGETACLASKAPDPPFDRPAPFGRYTVNLEAIEAVGVPALLAAWAAGKLVVVDEIGPMEILSPCFREVTLQILESDAAVLGTIAHRRHPFIDRVKAHPRVILRNVTLENRDDLPSEVAWKLAEHVKGEGPNQQ